MAISGDTAARPASATPAELHRAALKQLGTYLNHYGLPALGDADDGHAVDRCGPILAQVTCMLSFMGAAFEDSSDLITKGMESHVDQRVGKIISGALEGIETLVGLATFLLDDGEGC